MTAPTPPFPQDPAHGNGTCEQCGQPCAVLGPRWCPDCYYVDGVPRDRNERQGNPAMTEKSRDPVQAWPIIDGPLKGQTRACADPYFYAAELLAPGVTPPRHRPDPQAGTGRTEYRLRLLHAGGYAWSCAGE